MLDQAPNLLLREAQEIQVNGASTTSTPWIHALTLLLWRLGSTLWCDVIAARRNCLWNWFLVVCLPAGPVVYAWFARWVYCLISFMMVASWLKEQCFDGISSCICSPDGWFCFSRKQHLASICDANRYGKLPRLVGQVSDQLLGGGMYSLWDRVREHDEIWNTREGSMLLFRGLNWSTCDG